MCVCVFVLIAVTTMQLTIFFCLELCVDPRCSFATLVILGVITCGISILLWYVWLKNQSDDKGTYSVHICIVTYACVSKNLHSYCK